MRQLSRAGEHGQARTGERIDDARHGCERCHAVLARDDERRRGDAARPRHEREIRNIEALPRPLLDLAAAQALVSAHCKRKRVATSGSPKVMPKSMR
jgi:hypothetical protein